LSSSAEINKNDKNSRAPSTDQSIAKWFFFGLLVYFAAHVAMRVLVSSSLELDEAEQALFSQWVRADYVSKPPLYTWLQIIVFEIFGINVFGLSLLKNSLLATIYAFVFLSARLFFRDTRLALLAALSLLLIPQISWESQRDLTHSILVTAISAMSFYVVLRLLGSRASKDYLCFGLLVGLGMLSKYNYFIFVGAVLLTLFSYPKGRSVVFNGRIFMSLAIALAILLPYLLWLYSHLGAATASVDKFNILTHGYMSIGTMRLLLACISFVAPLCCLYLVLFPRGYLHAIHNHPCREISFPIHRYFIIVFCLLLTMIIFWGITNFKDRWMLPLFFLFPFYFLVHISADALHTKAVTRFTAVAMVAASSILVVIPGRVVLGPSFGYYSSFNFPYTTLADKIREYCPDPRLIIADRPQNAGNLRLQFPKSLVVAPTLEPIGADKSVAERKTVIFWNARESRRMPARLKSYLKNEFGIRPEELTVIYAELPYKYSDNRLARVAVGLLD